MSTVYRKPRHPNAQFQFTILTPTFNRAHTLARAYQSLNEQSYNDFEWVIVDDGSTDHTKDLVAQWQQEASFPIIYHWQRRQHKKSAFNQGVRLARGELVVALDSDDTLVADALYEMARWWWSINESHRHQFVGVTGLCKGPDGQVVGDLFPYDVLDTDALSLYFKYQVRGEKFGCLKQEVLLQFPFPEYPGFIPESLVWRAIARAGYRQRFVNQVFRVYHPSADGLTGQRHSESPFVLGLWLLAQDTLAACLSWLRAAPKEFCFAAVRYTRFRLHMLRYGQRPPAGLTPLGLLAKGLVLIFAPMGLLLFMRDCWQQHKMTK